MRKCGPHRSSLGLLASVIVSSSCGSEPRPETPDPESFRRVEAVGPFSVAIPRELSRLPIIGVDTEVDEFVGKEMRLGFSYGMHGSVPLPDGLLDYTTGQMTVDGRRGTWAAFTRPGKVSDGLPHGWIGYVATPTRWGERRGEPVGLTIYLSCSSRKTCELGPKVAAAVRFE